MDYTEIHYSKRDEYREKLLIEGYQRYHDWWHPIDIAGDSFMACMTFSRWMEHLLTFPDEEWFDRWLNEDDFIVPKYGGKRSARMYMKQFILQRVNGHWAKWINLNDKENPFKWISENPERKIFR